MTLPLSITDRMMNNFTDGGPGLTLSNIIGSVTVTSAPLPPDAATGTKQDEQTTYLASIDTKLTAPLVTDRVWLLSAGIDSIASVQSGTWTTGRTWLLTSGTDSIAAVQSGTWTTDRTWLLSSVTDSVSAAQLGTWTVQQGDTPTAVANAWPFKITDTTNTAAVKAASTAAVVTDPALVVAINPQTAINLPTGASTETTLSALNAKFNSLGQKTMANSAPIVIASDQTVIPVSQSGTWTVQQGATPTTIGNAWPFKITDTTNIAAVKAASTAAVATDPALVVAINPQTAINLPTGASTSSNQSTQITSLQLIDDVPTAQNGAFSKGNPIMGQMDDVSVIAATEDNCSAVRITAQRALHANLRDSSSTELIGQKTGANSIPVVQALDTSSRLFLTNKFRVEPIFVAISITSTITYTTIYTYTGSGLLLGCSLEFAALRAVIKIVIDGTDTIMDGNDITALSSLFASANAAGRTQLGGGIMIQSGNVDISFKYPIRFASSIVISARASSGAAFNFTQGMFYIQKET